MVFSPFHNVFTTLKKDARTIYCNEFIDDYCSQKASFVKQFCSISNSKIVLKHFWMCNRRVILYDASSFSTSVVASFIRTYQITHNIQTKIVVTM